MKQKKLIVRSFLATLLLVALFSCSKKDIAGGNNQGTPIVSSFQQNANPYDSYFAQYSKNTVKSLFEISNTKIGYEGWVVKVDSIINSLDVSAFSSIIGDLEQLNDSSDKQLFNTFFTNLATMNAYRSAEIVENQVYTSNRNQNEKNACLFLLSYMKTIVASIEDTQDYLPDGWHDNYLDCMREIHANMNWIQWTQFIIGIPESFLWEVASCMWDAAHVHQDEQ